jgi:UDPglucose 6-dehydrogenase/GDP-mannose 6-dehydrogenase
MNPEFLREGEAVIDFQHPDRIVLGGIDQKSLEVLAELYAPYRGVDVIRTTPKTAEMIKYTANSLLATMISFSNEIANLCTELGGIDVSDVMQGVHLDKRLTPIVDNGQRIVPNFTTYIEAGCGFGGSCFPKDVKALVAHGSHSGVPMRLLEAVIQINAQQPYKILTLLKKHFPSLKDLPVAVLGLAFKPGTDDMRESPAIPIVRELLRQGALIKAYDPVAMHEARKVFGDDRIQYCNTFQEAVEDVQGIVLLTRWPEFSEIPDMINALEQQPVVIDGRRMLEKNSVQKYDGIGLGDI